MNRWELSRIEPRGAIKCNQTPRVLLQRICAEYANSVNSSCCHHRRRIDDVFPPSPQVQLGHNLSGTDRPVL